MRRGAVPFRQADIVRAVKAARACGLEVARTEIAPDGRIVIVHKLEVVPSAASPFDEWKARRDADKA